MTAKELRAKHPRFVYRQAAWQYQAETLTITFDFLLEPDIVFQPVITLNPIPEKLMASVDRLALQNWVFHLGLIELFSYWKTAAPAEIVVRAGFLNPQQLAWWRDLLIKSMGEFFYTNDLDFTQAEFVKFTCNQPTPANQEAKTEATQAVDKPYLVPVGGGKDSALLLELLEENALDYDILLSHPQSPAAEKIAQLSRADHIIQLHRTFDPQLFKLNQTGYLNGHTPFSARLAFESCLVAWLLGQQQILVANEFSANEGNVPFHGSVVNHQYSKSFEFEQSFRAYNQAYLSPEPEYLSMLRPISELQIAGLFAKYPRYHSLFKSCNRNQKLDSWCGECAKCLFVFTVLYPFLEENYLVGKVFPTNLFENAALKPLASALLGKDAHKPFECVGTYHETLAAFYLSAKHFRQQHPGQPLPPVLDFVNQTILEKEQELERTAKAVICFWHDEHHLDQQLAKIVKAAQERLCDDFTAKP